MDRVAAGACWQNDSSARAGVLEGGKFACDNMGHPMDEFLLNLPEKQPPREAAALSTRKQTTLLLGLNGSLT